MNATLLKARLVALPVVLLVRWSAVSFAREPAVWSFLQLLGAAGLVVVVLAHIAEAWHLFPRMRWGHPDSVGHDLDFTSAVLGLTLLPLGYAGTRWTRRRRRY